MALSVNQGFDLFLQQLTPTVGEREAKARHRRSVETSLQAAAFGVSLFRETGSFTHGTGVRGYCDVDLLASIKAGRPNSSDTALGWVKSALQASFPSTEVVIRRPTVQVRFTGGAETWEVLPAFLTFRGGDTSVYDIPGAAGGWMDTAPTAHLAYVNEVNQRPVAVGGAKKLARLVKAWKYYNRVPVSSFYLEMRAAQYMADEPNFIAVWDICGLLEKLDGHQLAGMNDPKNKAGRFAACSSDATRREALSKLRTGAIRARKALDAHQKDDQATAFTYLSLLFGGRFPSR
ncbi:nucleotidyltransferase [Streptomyces sp. NPDC051135]|uniref:SMODS domain-containing nucleotidyltransferase n=1 Tax=unclassified Streptomyces TaxID=2593676 RepID=UPI003426581A